MQLYIQLYKSLLEMIRKDDIISILISIKLLITYVVQTKQK